MSAQRFEEVYFDGIDEMLEDARSRLDRLTAERAYREALWGHALLVDIRPEAQRLTEGQVHEALAPMVVERNVLEWRFDPRSESRLDVAAYDARVIVLCQDGYTSSLAADSLRRLGIAAATDVVGGFRSWRSAELPVARECMRVGPGVEPGDAVSSWSGRVV